MTGCITAQHGWGYDWRTYSSWQTLVPEAWQLTLRNRGYFKETNDRKFGANESNEKNKKEILVCHSFGLHLLDSNEIAAADQLVIISSFANFHVNENPLSKIAIQRMVKRLSSEPRAVLQDFYGACFGQPPSAVSEEFMQNCDLDLLISDLKKLNEARLDMGKISVAKSILILHGTRDEIVPVKAAKQLHERLPGSKLLLHPEAGHALPLTHAQWCIDNIFAVSK